MKNGSFGLLATKSELSGVSGWLLLLCINLAVLNPIVTIYQIVKDQPWRSGIGYTIFMLVFTLGLSIYSFIVGLKLWMIKPNAVRNAKAFLIVMLCVSGLSLITAFVRSRSPQEMVLAAMRAIIPFAVWWSYLNGSIRVKNTYTKAAKGLAPNDESPTSGSATTEN